MQSFSPFWIVLIVLGVVFLVALIYSVIKAGNERLKALALTKLVKKSDGKQSPLVFADIKSVKKRIEKKHKRMEKYQK